MRNAKCAVRPPSRLKGHRDIAARGPNAEAVIDVDRDSVPCHGLAVAAVIGAHHADASLMQGLKRRSAEAVLPEAIAPADAFPDGAAGAGEFKAAAPVRYWEAEASTFRVRLAQIYRNAIFVPDDEVMQHDATADRVSILLNALNPDRDITPGDANFERRALQVRASQGDAFGSSQDELRAFHPHQRFGTAEHGRARS